MAEGQHNLSVVREQFRRQAEVYAGMPVVSDPRLLDFIVSLSGVVKSDRMLDLASGPGFVTMAFAPHCAQVIGIDATDRLVAHARAEAARRGLANVSFLIGDVERMAIAAQAFDVAVCRFAFHHFPRPAAVVAEMRRVTRPDARLVIMLASEDPARADYHNVLERLCDPSHARALPAPEFERIFAEQELDVTYKQTRKTTFTADEFIAHGAPSATTTARILELMETAIEGDRAGLRVRREHGKLCFSHTGVSYVLRKRP
jgi:ubiquinone/menaquinone biosynthesis C-methylase UbiE